jgi:Ala-tRNA(Pro) deacylase
MTIALRLLEYLEHKGVDYELIRHPHSDTSMMTAEKAHVSGEDVAKCVVLEDDKGYVMAVIPATHQLELEAVKESLKRRMHLAGEHELPALFPDCELGAVPPLGAAYGYDVVVDEALAARPEVYFEAGDHAQLVHVSGDDFRALMQDARRASISRHG